MKFVRQIAAFLSDPASNWITLDNLKILKQLAELNSLNT